MVKQDVDKLKERIFQLELEVRHLRRAQTELEVSRDLYSHFFDFAPQGYLILDSQGMIEEASVAAAELLQTPRQSLVGRYFEQFIDLSDRRKVRAHLKECQASGPGKLVRTAVSIRTPKSKVVPIELLSSPSEDRISGNGASRLVFGTVIIDLTERREIEQVQEASARREQETRSLAERANRAKDEFLAVVSHELRTPLQPIFSWIELLQKRKDPKFADRGLKIIEQAARNQARIINDLLDMSRVNTGKLQLDLGVTQVGPIVREVLEAFAREAEVAGVRLVSILGSPEATILCDPARTRQILENLIGNAIKFTPRGGRIDVHLAATSERVVITVSDTGVGIAGEFLPRIFDRFRQVESGSTRKKGGLGLGLSIASYLVEQQGGKLTALSPGTGLGSTFTLSFPAATDSARLKDAESRALHPISEYTRLNGLKVLLADDEQDTREALVASLEESGAIVTAAGSAREALELFQADPPDVLLSDITMPEEDGYSLIRKIRKLEAIYGGRVPAAALTACASREDELAVVKAGFQCHIAKPVAGARLASAVKGLAAGKASKAIPA